MKVKDKLESNPIKALDLRKALCHKEIGLLQQIVVIKKWRNKNIALQFFYCTNKY